MSERFAHPHASVLDRVHLLDSHLFRSWRSSFARLPLALTSILASNLAYSSRCIWECAALSERPPLRAARAICARERSAAFGGPLATLSVLCVSVSPVGVASVSSNDAVGFLY